VGTFGFMAPEQFQGRAMPSTDAFGAAATALSLLTGEEPENLPHKGLALDVAAALGPRAAPALVSTLTALLNPDPDVRPASLRAGLAALPLATKPTPRAAATDGRERQRDEARAHRQAQRARVAEPREANPYGPAAEPGPARETSGPRPAEPVPAELEPGEGAPFFVRVVVTLVLTAVRVAIAIGLGVALPLVLTLLSLFFGKGMRRAAGQVREASRRAGQDLRAAQAKVGGGGRWRGERRRARFGMEPGPMGAWRDGDAPKGARFDTEDVPGRARIDGEEHPTSPGTEGLLADSAEEIDDAVQAAEREIRRR